MDHIESSERFCKIPHKCSWCGNFAVKLHCLIIYNYKNVHKQSIQKHALFITEQQNVTQWYISLLFLVLVAPPPSTVKFQILYMIYYSRKGKRRIFFLSFPCLFFWLLSSLILALFFSPLSHFRVIQNQCWQRLLPRPLPSIHKQITRWSETAWLNLCSALTQSVSLSVPGHTGRKNPR